MREIVARFVCILAVIVVLALAHLFAARHNRSPAIPAPRVEEAGVPGVPVPDPAMTPEIVRGSQVYAEQGCSSCHAIAGSGNPRNPLDGVGARLTSAELFDWVMGTGAAAGQLSPAVVRRKERYRDLPTDDANALVAYLASLGSRS